MVETDTVANNLVKNDGTPLRGDKDPSSRGDSGLRFRGNEKSVPVAGDKTAPTVPDDKALLGVLLNCPHCDKPYQIMNPQEGMVYQCQQCQTQFLVRKESTGKFQALRWSEEQILKILFDVPGETRQSQVVRAWRNAFDNLADMKAHEQFIYLCRQKNSLNLAREKYKQLALYLNWDSFPEYLKIII